MKKLLLAALAATLGVSACSSNNTKNDENYYSQNGYAYTSGSEYDNAAANQEQYQIIDQEFDNLLAPDTDYDSIPAYELQACGDNYLPPAKTALKGASKPAKSVGNSSRKKSASKAVKTQSDSSSSTNVSTTKKVINNTNIYYLDGSAPTSSTTSTTTYTSDEALPDTI